MQATREPILMHFCLIGALGSTGPSPGRRFGSLLATMDVLPTAATASADDGVAGASLASPVAPATSHEIEQPELITPR